MYVPILLNTASFVILSAPTSTLVILPLLIREHAALSHISITSMPSLMSSHVVSLLPWCSGRVSHATTCTAFPCSLTAHLIIPRAVPQSTHASAPALQWVSTTSPSSRSSAPFLPIRRFISTSSSAIASASHTAAVLISSTFDALLIFSSIRSIAQKRFFAVGLVRFSCCAAPCTSSSISSVLLAREDVHASAIPYAPAAPRAGAPLTRSIRIASQSSGSVEILFISSFSGSSVWSIRAMCPSSHQIVLMNPSSGA
ncbi:MAG: hypothetical protein PWR26_497 [Methanosarcinales archaeon]|nr:hypothetical protein [Methanosarcinales archaeon]